MSILLEEDVVTTRGWIGYTSEAADYALELLDRTGREVSLIETFGAAHGDAIARVLHHRLVPAVTPWRAVYEAFGVDDEATRRAAQADAADLIDVDGGPLSEALSVNTFKTLPPKAAASVVWPTLVAYFWMASQHKQPKIGKAVPAPYDAPALRQYGLYDDATNIVQTYFHPKGSKYKQPPENDAVVGGVDAEMIDLFAKAHKGQPIAPAAARNLLNRARRWMVLRKLSFPVFNVAMNLWKKGDRQGLLSLLPGGCDLYPAFSAFAGAKGSLDDEPDDVQLQQIGISHNDPNVTVPDGYKSIPLDATQTSKAAKAAGTPIGVHSAYDNHGLKMDVQGAFANPAGDMLIAVKMVGDDDKVAFDPDSYVAAGIAKGTIKVVQGHKDMPGTAYATAAGSAGAGSPPVTADPPAPPEGVPPGLFDKAMKFAAKNVKGGVDLLDSQGTQADKAAFAKYGKSLKPGDVLTSDNGSNLTVVFSGVDKGDGEVVFVLAEGTKTFHLLGDADLAEALTTGNAWFKGGPAPTDKSALFATAAEYFAHAFAKKFHLFKTANLGNTDASDALDEKYGQKIISGTVLKQGETTFTFQAAFRNPYVPGEVYLVYKDPAGKFNEVKDADLESAIKSGKVVPANLPGVTDVPDPTAPKPQPASLGYQPDAGTASFLKSGEKFVPVPPGMPAVGTSFHSKGGNSYTVNGYVDAGGKVSVYVTDNKTGAWDVFSLASVVKAVAPKSDTVSLGYTPTPAIVKKASDAGFKLVPQPEGTAYPVGTTVVSPAGKTYVISAYVTGQGWLNAPFLVNTQSQEAYPTNGINLGSGAFAKAGDKPVPMPKAKEPDPPKDLPAQPAVQHAPLVTPGTAAVYTPKYAAGSILKATNGEKAYAVLGISSTVGGPPRYAICALEVNPSVGVFFSVFAETMDEGANLVAAGLTPLAVATHLVLPFGYKRTINPPGWPSPGAPVNLQGSAFSGATFVTAVRDVTKAGSLILPVLSTLNTSPYAGTVYSYPVFTLGPAYLFAKKLPAAGYHPHGPQPATGADAEALASPEGQEQAAEFPTLNYALSKEAIAHAKESGETYVPEPAGAPYHVNTTLESSVTGGAYKLGAYFNPDPKDPSDVAAYLFAVNPPGEVPVAANLAKLAANYSIKFKYGNLLDDFTGEAVFGKAKGAAEIGYADAGMGLTLPSGPVAGWDKPTPVKQPPMQSQDGGKYASAGVVAILPPGGMYKTSSGSSLSPSPLVLLVHPLNGYGGYKLTIPKGTVEPGEGVEVTAVREAWEETGIHVRAVAHLGDFEGTSSTVRVFMASVLSGDPKAAGNETDAVTFKPLSEGYQTSAWYKTLADRDKKIIDAGYAWYAKNGSPHAHPVDSAVQYSQVTIVPKAPKLDYVPPKGLFTWMKANADAQFGKPAWAVPQAKFVTGGFPKVGDEVDVPALSLSGCKVVAYARDQGSAAAEQPVGSGWIVLAEPGGAYNAYALYIDNHYLLFPSYIVPASAGGGVTIAGLDYIPAPGLYGWLGSPQASLQLSTTTGKLVKQAAAVAKGYPKVGSTFKYVGPEVLTAAGYADDGDGYIYLAYKDVAGKFGVSVLFQSDGSTLQLPDAFKSDTVSLLPPGTEAPNPHVGRVLDYPKPPDGWKTIAGNDTVSEGAMLIPQGEWVDKGYPKVGSVAHLQQVHYEFTIRAYLQEGPTPNDHTLTSLLVTYGDDSWGFFPIHSTQSGTSEYGPEAFVIVTPAQLTGAAFDVAAKAAHAVSDVTTYEHPASGKLAKSKVDYLVDVTVHAKLVKSVYSSSIELKPQAPFVAVGYPPVGTKVKSATEDRPIVAYAYTYTYAVGSVPSAGRYLAVLLGGETGGLTYRTLFYASKAPNWPTHPPAGYAYISSPESFILSDEDGPSNEALSAPTVVDPWENLKTDSAIPISQKAIDTLKSAMSEYPWNAEVSSVSTYPTHLLTDIAYGDVFTIDNSTVRHCLGYAAVIGGVGSIAAFMIAGSPFGEIFALPLISATISTWKKDEDGTAASKATTPWMTHPDAASQTAMNASVGVFSSPTTAKKILQGYDGGYADAMPSKWAPFVTKLAQGGKASGVEFAYLVSSLGTAKLASPATKSDTVSQSPFQTSPPSPLPGTAKPKPKPKPAAKQAAVYQAPPSFDPSSPLYADLVANPDPQHFVKKGVVATTGGANSQYFEFSGPQDTSWFVKSPKDGNPACAVAESSAWNMMKLIGGTNALPVGHMQHGGAVVSIQPLLKGDEQKLPGQASALSDAEKVTVLRQHVVDMFLGDHDGHVGNWAKRDGNVIPVDRGQAWKFYAFGDAKSLSLDPHNNPPGNFGENYAKRLLLDWADGGATVPDAAFSAMRQAIDSIQAITDAQVKGVLGAYLEVAKDKNDILLTPAARTKVVKRVIAARDGYLDDWTVTLKKLNPDFAWPKEKLPPLPFKFSSADMGFTAQHAKIVQEAADSGWHGKSLQVDGDAVENQEVMVRQVAYSSPHSEVKVATLVHFRLTGKAAAKASQLIGPKATITVQAAEGPQPLSIDSGIVGNKYFGVLLNAVKTINYHLSPGSSCDGDYKKEKVQAVIAMQSELEQMISATNGPGKYAGLDNDLVNAMATKYLYYVKVIVGIIPNIAHVAAANKGNPNPTYLETMDQYLYEPKKAGAGVKAAPEPAGFIAVEKIIGQSFAPETSCGYDAAKSGGAVTVKDKKDKASPDTFVYGTSSPGSGFAGLDQYRIRINAVPGARLYFIPTPGDPNKGGNKNAYGAQAWGLIPGEATPAQVALLLKAFEEATSVPMSLSTPDDQEILYLSKQAFLLQPHTTATDDENKPLGGGKYKQVYGIKPKDGSGVRDEPYAAAMAKYSAGDKAGAKAALKQYVAARINASGFVDKEVTAETLSSLPNYNKSEHTTYVDPNGKTVNVGWRRTQRLGWTESALRKYLGDCYFGVGVTSGNDVYSLLQLATAGNGAMLANAVRSYYGVPYGTSSASTDIVRGGAVGVFGAIRKAPPLYDDMLYFDNSLFLRDDVYVIGGGDDYGDITEVRFTDPVKWKEYGWNKSTGLAHASTKVQCVARHDIDFRQYLSIAVTSNPQGCINLVKQRWGSDVRFAGGKKPEEVFTSK